MGLLQTARQWSLIDNISVRWEDPKEKKLISLLINDYVFKEGVQLKISEILT